MGFRPADREVNGVRASMHRRFKPEQGSIAFANWTGAEAVQARARRNRSICPVCGT